MKNPTNINSIPEHSDDITPYIKWLEKYLEIVEKSYRQDQSLSIQDAKHFISSIDIVMRNIQEIVNNKFAASKQKGHPHNKTAEVNEKIAPIIKKHKLIDRLEDISREASSDPSFQHEVSGLIRKVEVRLGANSSSSHANKSDKHDSHHHNKGHKL